MKAALQKTITAVEKISIAMKKKDYPARYENFDIAYQGLAELRKKNDFFRELDSLFEYCVNLLLKVNATEEVDKLKEVLEILTNLAEAFE